MTATQAAKSMAGKTKIYMVELGRGATRNLKRYMHI